MSIKEKIKILESDARQLEPSAEQRRRWMEGVQAHGEQFLEELPAMNAYRRTPGRGADLLELDIPEEGRPLEPLLEVIGEQVEREGINPASGYHFGYIPGGGLYPTGLGDYLAAVTNRYAGIFFANPGAVRMENQLLRWMCRLAGYPEDALGNLTSGGSLANLIAITTARDSKGVTASNVTRSVIYLTGQTHHCVQKALRIAGLSEAIIRYIPTNEHFQMEVTHLWEQVARDHAEGLRPFLVVASAGTTDTGAVDPLNDIADIAGEYGLWYHVDAAYGGFFMLVEEVKEKFRGIERSDSFAIDPHKGLFLSYGIGAVLIKDVEAQFRSHHYEANYMQDALAEQAELSPADLSPELTKHFRGLRMWLPLQLFGVQPFRAALEEKIWLCRYAYEALPGAGFEVGPRPELSILIFRYIPDEGDANAFNQQLVDYVKTNGRVFLSSTMIDGVFWIRLAIMSFRTHLPEVDICLDILRKGVREIEALPAFSKVSS